MVVIERDYYGCSRLEGDSDESGKFGILVLESLEMQKGLANLSDELEAPPFGIPDHPVESILPIANSRLPWHVMEPDSTTGCWSVELMSKC